MSFHFKISSKSKHASDSFLDQMDQINDKVSKLEESIINKEPVFKNIDEYGAENIFKLYNLSYDTRYYNNTTNEEFTGMNFTPLYHINEALEKDYVDKKPLYKKTYDDLKKKIDKYEFNKDCINKLYGIAQVTVNRGRKWKGSGYIMDSGKSSFQYSPWNSSTTYFYKIYDPKTKQIYTINREYADFSDMKKKYEEYKKFLIDLLNKTSENDILYDINKREFQFSTYQTKYKEFSDWMKDKYDPKLDLKGVKDIEQEKQNKKSEEFKKKKMPELIEWVKTHTDKKGDDIEKLAERIFIKRYG